MTASLRRQPVSGVVLAMLTTLSNEGIFSLNDFQQNRRDEH